jgi:N-acetylglutamate synthase-like GNAT family acetyltransferase
MARGMMTEDLRRLAEDAGALLPPTRGGRSERRPGFTLKFEGVDAPKVNAVHGVRVEDVPAAVAEARAWFAAHGRAHFTWWIGSSARPADIVERLVAEGARADGEVLRAMVLEDEPPGGGPDAPRVRPVESLEDFRTIVDIQCEAFHASASEREQVIARAAERWREIAESGTSRRYIAEAGGRAVGTGGMARLEPGPALLVNGSVLEHARGRGAYRELVRARWRDARDLGWLPLVVQAGPMSAPILERVGFRTVGTLRLLSDDAG